MKTTVSKSRRPSFADACAQYVHRFTATHVPQWTKAARPDGRYYAPQYASDAEWYANTVFPGEPGHYGPKTACNSSGQTWPYGQSLTAPYNPANRPQPATV